MDDYRAGRLGNKPRRPGANAAVPADSIIVRFPPRRILIAGLPTDLLEPVATSFLGLRSRVALFTDDNAAGAHLAHDSGARHCPFDQAVTPGETFTRHLDRLFHDWHNLDIVITTPALAPAIHTAWANHTTRYPIPTDYRPRLITIAPHGALTPPPQPNDPTPSQPPQQEGDPTHFAPLLYHIATPAESPRLTTSLTKLLLYLTHPDTTYLHTPATFRLTP